MSVNVSLALRRQLRDTELRFRKSCEQVFVLNRLVCEAIQRFNLADHTGNRISRYNTRLRLSVLEGVRYMYSEYASKMAVDIVDLNRRVLDDLGDQEYASGDESNSDLSAFDDNAFSDSEGGLTSSDGDWSYDDLC